MKGNIVLIIILSCIYMLIIWFACLPLCDKCDKYIRGKVYEKAYRSGRNIYFWRFHNKCMREL